MSRRRSASRRMLAASLVIVGRRSARYRRHVSSSREALDAARSWSFAFSLRYRLIRASVAGDRVPRLRPLPRRSAISYR